jgi:hypothetical protein
MDMRELGEGLDQEEVEARSGFSQQYLRSRTRAQESDCDHRYKLAQRSASAVPSWSNPTGRADIAGSRGKLSANCHGIEHANGHHFPVVRYDGLILMISFLCRTVAIWPCRETPSFPG